MASTPTEDLLKAYEGLTPSAVVETSDGDQRPLCNETFEPAPVAPGENDLTKAKRIVCSANDVTAIGRAFIALRRLKVAPEHRSAIVEQLRQQKASLATAVV